MSKEANFRIGVSFLCLRLELWCSGFESEEAAWYYAALELDSHIRTSQGRKNLDINDHINLKPSMLLRAIMIYDCEMDFKVMVEFGKGTAPE